MADIFISYAREDSSYVESLAARLAREEWTVWSDRQIQAGRHYSTVIEREIEAARCVLVVWSKHSISSDWVQNEATEGLTRNILIPLMIDPVRLPLEFRRVQTIDLTQTPTNLLSDQNERIIASIEGLIGPSPKKRKARTAVERKPLRKPAVPPVAQASAPALKSATAKSPESSALPNAASPSIQEEMAAALPDETSRTRARWWPWLVSAGAIAVVAAVAILANRSNEAPKLPTKAEAEAMANTRMTPFVGAPPDNWMVVEATLVDGWHKRIREPKSGIEFLLVEHGMFQMGAPTIEDGYQDNEFEHAVQITKPFYLSVCETSFGQYSRVVKDGGRTSLKPEDPVMPVTWNEAREFCLMIGCELPTEAQWEYAARAGTHDRFWWGDSAAEGEGKGNFADQSANSKHQLTFVPFPFNDTFPGKSPIGSFRPNPWDFHDMLGNVWEWCFDGYRDDYENLAVMDPMQPPNHGHCVLRGGSYLQPPKYTRCAYRHAESPSRWEVPLPPYGFRAVKNLP